MKIEIRPAWKRGPEIADDEHRLLHVESVQWPGFSGDFQVPAEVATEIERLQRLEARLAAYHTILIEIAEGKAWENPQKAAARFLAELDK